MGVLSISVHSKAIRFCTELNDVLYFNLLFSYGVLCRYEKPIIRRVFTCPSFGAGCNKLLLPLMCCI